jgi:hypothetical protein
VIGCAPYSEHSPWCSSCFVHHANDEEDDTSLQKVASLFKA